MTRCSPKTMALWIPQKARRERIVDCFNDNCLTPFGYRATSECPTIHPLSGQHVSNESFGNNILDIPIPKAKPAKDNCVPQRLERRYEVAWRIDTEGATFHARRCHLS